MKSEHVSFPNNKQPIGRPNEDYCICDDANGVYVVLDGVSRDAVDGVYPNPSPAAVVSEIFADEVHKSLFEMLKSGISDYEAAVRNSMRIGNGCIAEYNNRGSYDFLPGTVGIVLLVRDGFAYFGFIGDGYGKVVSKHESRIFTRCQTEYVHKHKKEYTTDEIRNFICNNKDHPAGYGVLNGAKEALQFIETGCFEFLPHEKILLYTDGFDKYLKNLSAQSLYELTIENVRERTKSIAGIEEDDRTLVIISRQIKMGSVSHRIENK